MLTTEGNKSEKITAIEAAIRVILDEIINLRLIHLKHNNLSDADIMSLTRHKNFAAYAKYLRDLGMAADSGKINAVSRKV